VALALCGGAGTLEQEECRESTGLRTWARNEITLSADYHAKDVKSVAGLNDGEGQPPPPSHWPACGDVHVAPLPPLHLPHAPPSLVRAPT
jgi:hypothetical protein